MEDGFAEGSDVASGREDGRKKQRKMIQHLAACIGDSLDLEYSVKEENIDYSFKTQLTSGDVFFVGPRANSCSYKVTAVRPNSKPAELCVRQGTLLARFTKN